MNVIFKLIINFNKIILNLLKGVDFTIVIKLKAKKRFSFVIVYFQVVK